MSSSHDRLAGRHGFRAAAPVPRQPVVAACGSAAINMRSRVNKGQSGRRRPAPILNGPPARPAAPLRANPERTAHPPASPARGRAASPEWRRDLYPVRMQAQRRVSTRLPRKPWSTCPTGGLRFRRRPTAGGTSWTPFSRGAGAAPRPQRARRVGGGGCELRHQRNHRCVGPTPRGAHARPQLHPPAQLPGVCRRWAMGMGKAKVATVVRVLTIASKQMESGIFFAQQDARDNRIHGGCFGSNL